MSDQISPVEGYPKTEQPNLNSDLTANQNDAESLINPM